LFVTDSNAQQDTLALEASIRALAKHSIDPYGIYAVIESKYNLPIVFAQTFWKLLVRKQASTDW